MPCLAITFGQAPQAEHRRLSQSATMASRTRTMGRFDGGFSNTFSARLTPFRQAFVACRRIEAAYRQPRLFDEPPPKSTQPSFLGDAA